MIFVKENTFENVAKKKCRPFCLGLLLMTCHVLTHWGRVTHISISKHTIIGSGNALSPDRCQAIIWTDAGILLIWPLGTNFSEILIKIHISSFKKMHLKMSSAKCRPSCFRLNVLLPPGEVNLVSSSGVSISHNYKTLNCHLNTWGLNKMADILQMTFSKIFFLNETVFSLEFHWHLFLRVQLPLSQNWLR